MTITPINVPPGTAKIGTTTLTLTDTNGKPVGGMQCICAKHSVFCEDPTRECFVCLRDDTQFKVVDL